MSLIIYNLLPDKIFNRFCLQETSQLNIPIKINFFLTGSKPDWGFSVSNNCFRKNKIFVNKSFLSLG